MDKKLATYICTGCGIGEALDIDQLSKVAQKECKAALVKTHACLCGPEGVAMLRRTFKTKASTAS